MKKTKPRINRNKESWLPVIIFLCVATLTILNQTGYINLHFGNSNDAGVLEKPEEQTSPSVKIEHATAAFKGVSPGYNICTVEMSGTITGPECSDLSIAWGTSGEPGIRLYPIECSEWSYVGTSGICWRDLSSPATTKWSITTDHFFLKGKGTEFFAVLSTPKLPLSEMSMGNPCAVSELGNQTWDSVILMCG